MNDHLVDNKMVHSPYKLEVKAITYIVNHNNLKDLARNRHLSGTARGGGRVCENVNFEVTLFMNGPKMTSVLPN